MVNFTFPWDNRAGVGSPAASIAPDTFSVRWTGKLTPPASGTYTLYTRSDDRVRLRIDGSLLINNWTDHAIEEDSATITLVKDQAYTIQLDWVENTEDCTISLWWASSANGISKQIIPASALTPAP